MSALGVNDVEFYAIAPGVSTPGCVNPPGGGGGDSVARLRAPEAEHRAKSTPPPFFGSFKVAFLRSLT